MHDVVIIGGGYSGCMIDSLLQGFDTLVVEEKGIGSKNVCAVTFLEIVDSDDVVVNTYNSYTLMTTNGESEVYDFEDNLFCLVDYEKLCKSLLRSNVVRKKALGYKDGRVNLGDEIIKAKIIVDCSGIGGERIRSAFGFKLPRIINALNFERVKTKALDPSSFYLIVGFANFGGWIYPLNDRYAEFGMANRFKRGERIQHPDLEKARKIFGLEKAGREISSVYPYGFVKRVVKGNVVIFGDAAGLTHPVYGMSLHYIHKMAPRLAEVIKKSLRGEAKLKHYQKIWSGTLRRASNLIAAGYSVWDLPLDTQLRLTKLQIKVGVSPKSILNQMWALDEKFDVLARKSPKLTDYPISLYLKHFLYKTKFLL
jgi:flavin-dependent dehydrogenase